MKYSAMSTLKTILKLCIILSFITQCLTSNGRYDIETEAYKLYGEDFKSVLRRFRKTPDYLKILHDKMSDLKVYVKEMSLQVLHYYHGRMTQRVNEIIGITNAYVEESVATTPSPAVYARRKSKYPFANKINQINQIALSRKHRANYARRQEDETDKEGVKILDQYSAFNRSLSVIERNSFRDLGFEFAGNLIHAIIENMGPVTETTLKNKKPYAGDTVKGSTTTSEHPHTHKVTTGPLKGNEQVHNPPENEVTADTFRFRAQSNWNRMNDFFSKWQ